VILHFIVTPVNVCRLYLGRRIQAFLAETVSG
jgi:hypothetical protein